MITDALFVSLHNVWTLSTYSLCDIKTGSFNSIIQFWFDVMSRKAKKWNVGLKAPPCGFAFERSWFESMEPMSTEQQLICATQCVEDRWTSTGLLITGVLIFPVVYLSEDVLSYFNIYGGLRPLGRPVWGLYIKASNNRNYVSKDPAVYLLPAASGGFLAASKSNVRDSAAKSAVLSWSCVDSVGCTVCICVGVFCV